MYCDNCGCELGENVRKCPVCGKEFPLIEPEVDDSTTVLTSEPDVLSGPKIRWRPVSGRCRIIRYRAIKPLSV